MIALCKHCGIEFLKNRKDKIFCSRKCKVKAKDKRLERRTKKNKSKIKARNRKKRFQHLKDTKCNSCGFVAIHPCQLDIDHIDGNHSNNNLYNLQTLCANCHRIKTFINKDWEKK